MSDAATIPEPPAWRAPRRLYPRTLSGALLILVAVIVGPMLLILGLTHYDRFQSRRAETSQANLEIARTVAIAFEAYVAGILQQEYAIGQAITYPRPVTQLEASTILEANATHAPAVRALSWVDPNGKALASSLPKTVGVDVSDRDYFRKIADGQEWVVSDLLGVKLSGRPSFIIARGVRDSTGTLLGVVLAVVEVERLGEVLPVELGADGSVAIMDSRGVFVSRFPEADLTGETREALAGEPLARTALAGEEAGGTFPSAIGEGARVGSFVPIRSIGWVTMASRLESAAMGPVYQGLARDLALAVLVLLGSAVVSFLIARGIAATVGRLSQHALALGRGDYGRRLEVGGLREVAAIASALNAMAGEINARDESLQTQSAEMRAQFEEVRVANEALLKTQLALLEVERKIRYSEQQLRLVTDALPMLISYVDAEQRYRLNNKAYEDWFGHPSAAIHGRHIAEVLGKQAYEAVRGNVESALSGQTVSFETLVPYKDGGTRHVAATYVPDVGDGGGVRGFVALVEDITRRKQTEEALSLSEERYRSLFTHLTEGFALREVIYDAEGTAVDYRFLEVNPAFEAQTGLKRSQAVGRTASEVFPSLEQPWFERYLDVARGGGSIHFEDYSETLGRYFEVFAYCPAPDQFASLFLDITKRKQAEMERQERLARQARLAEYSRQVLAERTVAGFLQKVVDAACDLTSARIGTSGHGYVDGQFLVGASSRAEDMPPCPPGERFVVEKGGVYLDLVNQSHFIRLTDEELRRHPHWWGLPEGHGPLRGLLGARLVGHDGQVTGLIMVSDKGQGDFTSEDVALLMQLAALASLGLQHIEARESAEWRAAELAAVFSSLAEAVLVYDISGRVVRANPATMTVFGFDPVGLTREEIVARYNIRYPDGRPLTPDNLPSSRVARGDLVGRERYLFTNALGCEFVVEATAAPMAADGNSLGVVAIWRDVTERERLLREVAGRMAELDAANKELEAFSYAVSHDLRTPLRAIDGFSQVLLEDYADRLDEQAREYLGFVRGGSQKMGRLIDDLLSLSRVTRAQMRRETVDLSALATDVMDDLRASQPVRCVDFSVEAGLVAEGDAALLRVLLANLLDNAWKFTGKRPEARIECGSLQQDGKSVYFVRDNGAGFDMAYVGKLFGAFQRLHAENDFPGTGIGLATVQRIVRRHGGRVWAEGAMDQGATFFFTLANSSGR